MPVPNTAPLLPVLGLRGSLVNEPRRACPATSRQPLGTSSCSRPYPRRAEMSGARSKSGLPPTVRRSIAGGLQLGMLEAALLPGRHAFRSDPAEAESTRSSSLNSRRAEVPGTTTTRNTPEKASPHSVSRPGKAVRTGCPRRHPHSSRLFILNAIVSLITAALQ